MIGDETNNENDEFYNFNASFLENEVTIGLDEIVNAEQSEESNPRNQNITADEVAKDESTSITPKSEQDDGLRISPENSTSLYDSPERSPMAAGISDFSEKQEDIGDVSSTRILYNYLCVEADNMYGEDAAESFYIFETIIEDELANLPQDSNLRQLLEKYGWNQDCFEAEIDIIQLRQELGNLYLAHSNAGKDISLSANVYQLFSPDLLLTALRKKGNLDTFSKSFTGTCMLADISGFTNLASSLCRQKAENQRGTSSMPSSSFGNTSRTIRDYLAYAGSNNGTNGLDELRSTTNKFLGNLVQTIYSYGGDVIEFAGDALLCVFSDDFNSRLTGEPHFLRAFKCSSQLTSDSAASAASVPSSAKQLSLHIALSTGEMFFSILGGYSNRWIYLLNGECVPELSSCIDEAKMHETVMTAALHQLIQREETFKATLTNAGNMKVRNTHHHATQTPPARNSSGVGVSGTSHDNSPESASSGSALSRPAHPSSSSLHNNTRKTDRGGRMTSRHSTPGTAGKDKTAKACRKSFGQENTDLLRYFVPEPVLAAMTAGRIDVSEMRFVTTIFLKLDSFSPATYADPIALQDFVLVVQEALHECGGFFRQILVDDKGCVAIGMWGVPSFSHKNNGILALKCSFMIQNKSREIHHQCSIGITSGLVYCSSIGSPIRRDYVGIGDKVNLAARLMGKAKGRILVDEETLRILPVETKTSLERAEDMFLKGIEGSYAPYCYVPNVLPIIEDETNVLAAVNFVRSDIMDVIKSQLDHLSRFASSKTPLHRSMQNEWQHISTIARQKSGTMTAVQLQQAYQTKVQDDITAANATTNQEESTVIMPAVAGRLSYVNCIVIEGVKGMGITSLAQNYRDQVDRRKRKIACYSVEGRLGDEITAYGVVSRLCIVIIQEKLHTAFADEFEQRRVITMLLKQTNPDMSPSETDIRLNELATCLRLDWSEEVDIDQSINDDSRVSPQPSMGALSSTGNKTISLPVPANDKTFSFLDLFKTLLTHACTALVIESAHYCDELSWLLLHDLLHVEGISFTLFITKYPITIDTILRETVVSDVAYKTIFPKDIRDDSSTVEPLSYLNIINNRALCEFISLQSLRKEDVELLLCKVLDVDTISPSLVNTVFDVSLANPQWVADLGLFIKQRGIEQFMQKIGNNKSSPLATLITYRFDNLSSAEQIALKYASVIGDRFHLDTLFAIIPLPNDGRPEETLQKELQETLQSLVKLGFVQYKHSSDLYTFQHELVRDTIYSQWPPSIAAQVHQNVAAHLEATENHLHMFYPRLCYHYKMSKANHELAYKYTVKAADQYVGICAYKEALMYARSAYEMAQTRTELNELLMVVRVALSDINPNLVYKFGNSLLASKAVNKHSAGFRVLKKDIKAKIEIFSSDNSPNFQRISNPLEWQASYAAGRSAQTATPSQEQRYRIPLMQQLTEMLQRIGASSRHCMCS